MRKRLLSLLLFCLILTGVWTIVPASAASDPSYFQAMVEADWVAQEHRKGKTAGGLEAAHEAYARARKLYASLTRLSDAPELSKELAVLENLGSQMKNIDSLQQEARLVLYNDIRWLTRKMALKNPLFAEKRIAFMQRRRFICQMMHEYMGYYCDYGDIAGGGVYILNEPGRSLSVSDLIRGRLPKGNYTTLSLSYDGKTIYFAFAPRSDKKPEFYSQDRRFFHVYAMDSDGGNLRQLTRGPNDYFDPCPLPDGGIACMATRRGGFVRCNNPWEPVPAYTLHRMDADGGNVRTLSFHETNEWHPSVLADGRIVYIRWDYVDRSAANYHGLWVSNPDGTNPSSLFGNYTQRINACYQPRAIPGSNRILFIAGAHHADVGGSLVIVDPDRVELDPETGQDRFESLELLTPEVCFPEGVGWPESYFHSPWPLSEDFYLVSFSFEPLPGMNSKTTKDTPTGLYYFDRFGNMELLYKTDGISCMYPIPLAPRKAPRIVPSTLDPAMGDEGEFVLANVRTSLFQMPADRQIRELRIFQVLPKSESHIANQPRIGHANAESARMMLGTVPVEADGSAYFRAPARKPLYFQAVDEWGRAVQSMRSVTYLQPGERRSCLGCHEQRRQIPVNRRPLLALERPPSQIKTGPEGTQPMSYPLLVQGVLDRHCVRCHDGGEGELKSKLALSGEPAGQFSRSYENLKPFIRWYEWGGGSITQLTTHPGRIGADESPLMKVLEDKIHTEHVQLENADRQKLHIWLDGNIPFYGVYPKDQRMAQREGKAVPVPQIQ